MRGTRTAILFLALFVLLVGGAEHAQAKKKKKMVAGSSGEMPIVEVRARLYDFSDRFVGIVSAAADKIAHSTQDPAIKRRALQWKIHAIPACHRAVFQPNPFAGGIDLWALIAQMQDYFETGAGRDLFGEWQPIAVEAANLLLTEIEKLAVLIEPSQDPEQVQFLHEWATEHPLESTEFVRESTRPLTSRLIGDRKGGAFSAIGRLEEQVSDLSERVTIYSDVLPKVARWQAELFSSDLINSPDIQAAFDTTEELRAALERTAAGVEGLPDLVDGQVAVALEVLRAEVDQAFKEVDRQRRETLELVPSERAIILEAVTQERVATIDAVRQEREATIADVDLLAGNLVDQTTARVEQLVDRMFWRVCWLVGLLAGGFLVAGLVALAAFGRRRPA